MAPNRITRGGAAPRALVLLTTAALLAGSVAGCGGGATTTVARDKAADAETLNNVLARQLAAIRAYGDALPLLRGADRVRAREFRAQEQEHVDAVVKLLRGFGEPAQPQSEEIESGELKSAADALAFLYELESASVAYDLRAISHLSYPWPRSLLGSVAANQAQHLVLLRRALGADPGELAPEAFEDGTTPDPSEKMSE